MTLVLKEPSSPKETLINLIVRIEGESKRLKYSTGEKILPQYWDKNSMCADVSKVKGSQGKENLKIINAILSRYQDVFNVFYNNCRLNSIPFDLDNFRQKLDEEFKGKSQRKGNIRFLIEFGELFINSTNRAEGTLKAYRNAINTINEYQKARNKKLRFEDIDICFYDDFIKFLQEKGYALNTVGARIKNIKVFMANAYEQGYHDNQSFKNRKFKVISEQTDKVFLTEEELKKIWEYDFSKNPKLKKVRDLFILQCRTGVRFSDLSKINSESIIEFEGVKILKIKTQKTGETVAIPLHWQVEEVLRKYDGGIFKVPSNQKYNEYIKIVCSDSGLNDEVILNHTQSGMKVSKKLEKWECVSSHTARRTSATLGYLAGIPVTALRKITGHKSEKSFFLYIRINPEESAANVAKTHAQFFQRPLMKVAN